MFLTDIYHTGSCLDFSVHKPNTAKDMMKQRQCKFFEKKLGMFISMHNQTDDRYGKLKAHLEGQEETSTFWCEETVSVVLSASLLKYNPFLIKVIYHIPVEMPDVVFHALNIVSASVLESGLPSLVSASRHRKQF